MFFDLPEGAVGESAIRCGAENSGVYRDAGCAGRADSCTGRRTARGEGGQAWRRGREAGGIVRRAQGEAGREGERAEKPGEMRRQKATNGPRKKRGKRRERMPKKKRRGKGDEKRWGRSGSAEEMRKKVRREAGEDADKARDGRKIRRRRHFPPAVRGAAREAKSVQTQEGAERHVLPGRA